MQKIKYFLGLGLASFITTNAWSGFKLENVTAHNLTNVKIWEVKDPTAEDEESCEINRGNLINGAVTLKPTEYIMVDSQFPMLCFQFTKNGQTFYSTMLTNKSDYPNCLINIEPNVAVVFLKASDCYNEVRLVPQK